MRHFFRPCVTSLSVLVWSRVVLRYSRYLMHFAHKGTDMTSETLMRHVELWKQDGLTYTPGAKETTATLFETFRQWCVMRHGSCSWGRREFANALVASGFELDRGAGGIRIARNYEIGKRPDAI